MHRFRLTMILGALALAFSGCLSPAPSGNARSESESENADIDEAVSTAPDQVAPEAATQAPSHGVLPFDPCPCTNPVCRPGCSGH